MIAHQTITIDGREADILFVLFNVRYCNAINVLEAANLLRDALISKMEPVYGLTTVHSILRSFQARSTDSSNAEAHSATCAFGLLAIGKFILRLPAEVAEDELPRLKDTLISCLNHPHSLVIREAAAATIIAFQLVLTNETHLFALLEGLAEDKKNLLTYLFDKHSVRKQIAPTDSSSNSSGLKKLAREMKRLDRRTSMPPTATHS
jgi:CLIP-associating protein 1/2